MADKEQRDMYIAFGVGGGLLILILLYVFGGTQQVVAADGQVIPTPPAAQTPYNYNIAPYVPAGAIGNPTPRVVSNDGCCDRCGPYNGNTYNNVTTHQFSTLLGYGNDLLAYGGNG